MPHKKRGEGSNNTGVVWSEIFTSIGSRDRIWLDNSVLIAGNNITRGRISREDYEKR